MDAYRSKLSDSEQELWIRALTQSPDKFSIEELVAAFDELIRNPPKYQLDDGSVQIWRGMPKLPDLIGIMLGFREQKTVGKLTEERRQEQEELQRYEQRIREHPEEFVRWTEQLAKDFPGMFKKFNMVSSPLTDAELEEKKRQAIKKAAEISDKG